MMILKKETLDSAMSYQSYRAKIDELLNIGKYSTINDVEDADMIAYTRLNVSRMNRIDKTIKITDLTRSRLTEYRGNVTWLVITEGWCGDAAQIVPTIQAMADLGNIDCKYVFRDEHLELIDQFLTNGGRAIPKVLVVDNESLEVVANWGPRPTAAQQIVNETKEKNIGNPQSVFYEDLKYAIHKWYAEDHTISTQLEALDALLEKGEA
jgi:Thioredoxin